MVSLPGLSIVIALTFNFPGHRPQALGPAAFFIASIASSSGFASYTPASALAQAAPWSSKAVGEDHSQILRERLFLEEIQPAHCLNNCQQGNRASN
jgi:hypothetical protein